MVMCFLTIFPLSYSERNTRTSQPIWAITNVDMINIRQRIYEWLLKITSNTTLRDHQRYENHNLPINEQIEMTSNIKMYSDANNYFSKFNLSHYNITPENIGSFLEMINMTKYNVSKPNTVARHESDSCDEYCTGSFRDALSGYKFFHGYVSLVVSII